MQNVVRPTLAAKATTFGLGAEIYSPTGLSGCLSVKHENSRPVRDIVKKFSEYHPIGSKGEHFTFCSDTLSHEPNN